MVLAAAFMWGCIGIFVRHLNALGLEAKQITASRCLTCALLILLWILVTDRSRLKIHLKDAGWFLANGILSIYVFNTAYQAAISLVSLSTAVVLLYTAPAFVMLLSVLFFHERFTWNKGLCLLLCIGGSALVSGITGGMDANPAGIALGLVSGVGYALYSIFSSVILKKYHPFTNILYTFFIAGVAGLLTCDAGSLTEVACQSPSAFLWVVSNGVVTGFLAYVCYTSALQYMRPSKAAILATLEPVVATLAGILVYGETVTLTGGLGMLMVFTALVLANVPQKQISE